MADETHRLIYADTAYYMLLEGYDIRDVPTAADVQPVDRWISVKDRVPEAGVHVLVTDGIHMMVTWCEYVDNQCLWVDNYYTYVNVRFKEVTHWMPLPEPPKEECLKEATNQTDWIKG